LKQKQKRHSGWFEITTIPKGVKMHQDLDKGGRRLGIIPAHSQEEAADIYLAKHKTPKRVRVFPVELIR